MAISETEALPGAGAAPARGDTVELTVNGVTVTGKVTSAYIATGGSARVSVTCRGRRYTRLASSVRVTHKATRPPEPPPSPLAHRPGEPAASRGKRYPAQVLTAAEADALIAIQSPRYFTGRRNRALLTLLRRSGLRVSEVLALRPSDVSLDRHSIRLRATKSQKAQTRGFHPAADLPLLKWMDARRERGLDVNGTPLFCTWDGGPVSPQYVRGLLKRLAAKAGIDKRVHPHGLRHTFAVDCVESGMPITAISKLLGHSSVAVTAVYLEHLTNGEAVAALEAAELPGTGPAPVTVEAQVADLREQVANLTAFLGTGRRPRPAGGSRLLRHPAEPQG